MASSANKDNAAQFVAKQAKKYPKFESYYEQFEDLYVRKLRPRK